MDIVLHGGPGDGERVTIAGNRLEVLKVPIEVEMEDEGDIRHPDPPTEMRVAWYRRSGSCYEYDRMERLWT